MACEECVYSIGLKGRWSKGVECGDKKGRKAEGREERREMNRGRMEGEGVKGEGEGKEDKNTITIFTSCDNEFY